ncbi:MAG: VWA domain-containing protein [Chloroflexota bacterium]
MSYAFDPYKFLNLAPNAGSEEITVAYQEMVAQLAQSSSEAAARQREQIQQAYDILRDPIARRRYDEYAREHNPDEKKQGEFQLRLTPSKRIVKPLGEDQVLYMLADVFAPPGMHEQMEEREVRLNLTIVIDKSKSMDDDGRMRRVIAAAQTIIGSMTQDDIISIVAFNDRAETVIAATPVRDQASLKARVSTIKPSGGTEIFKGLDEAYHQTKRNLSQEKVNHIILLTDGRTFGDEPQSLELARKAAKEGISISAMGLGSDWNDTFLDQLASLTGGTSTYIRSVSMVSSFMEDQLRSLSNAYAERVMMTVAVPDGVEIEMAFKISPTSQPLTHDSGEIPLASLQAKRPISVLMQLRLPAQLGEGEYMIGRVAVSADMMLDQAKPNIKAQPMIIAVQDDGAEDSPPNSIVDALSKLTLYRLQEKAMAALEEGNIEEATRHLTHLGTRLIDMGEVQLGQLALAEAETVRHTRTFSGEQSKKSIKYKTRALVGQGALQSGMTNLFNNDDDD